MKICPVCQQAVGLNARVCAYCGHRFLSPLVGISLLAIALLILIGVLLFRTSSR